MATRTTESPLIAVVGETASGKSSLGLELAELFNGEIICADSWTVYKGFTIGTAKPSMADQSKIPHHLINIADPEKGFSVASFKKLAETSIMEINRRKKIPFIVGGTGLYIDSILYDYQFLPPPTATRRNYLNSLELTNLLSIADDLNLDTTAIDDRNKRRLIRLIENNGQMPTKKSLRKNSLILGIKRSQIDLESRITKRVDAMLSMGLLEEVENLAEVFGWEVEPMKGIGYREWEGYFRNQQTVEETRDKIIRSTIGLVKKQRTWFKRNKSIHWIENKRQAVDLVTTFLNK